MGITPMQLNDMLRNNPDIVMVDDGAPRIAVKLPVPTEDEEQAALFEWAALNEAQHPELAMLYHVPNGGYRPPQVGKALKFQGVKAGVPDICLPVARGKFHALYLELKRVDHSNHATDEQIDWINRLRYYGSSAVVAYGLSEAIQAIIAYLSQEN